MEDGSIAKGEGCVVVQINRNQYFLIGVLLVIFGAQLRWVEVFVLNEPTTRFLAERAGKVNSTTATLMAISSTPQTHREIRPPRWIGWCLTSVGAVLILHSVALKASG